MAATATMTAIDSNQKFLYGSNLATVAPRATNATFY
jgi:hypothetical protein